MVSPADLERWAAQLAGVEALTTGAARVLVRAVLDDIERARGPLATVHALPQRGGRKGSR